MTGPKCFTFIYEQNSNPNFEFAPCLRILLESNHETLFTYQSQHTLLVSDPESRVVELLVGRQQVHIGGRVLEEQRKQNRLLTFKRGDRRQLKFMFCTLFFQFNFAFLVLKKI